MKENVENLILEHLKAFQSTLGRIESDVSEIKTRLANLEIGQATMMQHIGHQASMIAQQQVSNDSLAERIKRIEKRLELTA